MKRTALAFLAASTVCLTACPPRIRVGIEGDPQGAIDTAEPEESPDMSGRRPVRTGRDPSETGRLTQPTKSGGKFAVKVILLTLAFGLAGCPPGREWRGGAEREVPMHAEP
jgi:hypothetical protein